VPGSAGVLLEISLPDLGDLAVEREVQLLRQARDESLVVLRFAAAQLMVEVRDASEVHAQFAE
jgi:hypothetical protein